VLIVPTSKLSIQVLNFKRKQMWSNHTNNTVPMVEQSNTKHRQ